jgi:recombination protein RecT
MIQLAMRTGQFKVLNADAVYEGEKVESDRLTGAVKITGTATSDKAIGYFAHMELVNGFTKTIYWEHEKVMAHAKKYSKSFSRKSSTWVTNPVSMCIKTVVRQLLSKWAPMSIDFIGADGDDEKMPEPKDITPEPKPQTKPKKTKSQESKKTDKDGNEIIDADFKDIDTSKTETTDPGPTEPDGEDPY